MRNLRPRRRSLRLLFVTTVLLAVAAGVAYATIPDSGGGITACRLNALGTIRLIDPSGPSSSLLSHCTALETQITWNQKGVAGVAGTNGKNGTNGTNGTNGAPGAKGDPCLPTVPACVGPKGDQGNPGINGTNGTNGAPGQGVTLADAGGNCANGGTAVAAQADTRYVCNGKDGTNGSSLTKIEDLNGIACTDHNGHASAVVVAVAADGSVSLTCPAAAPPLPPPNLTLTGNGSFGSPKVTGAVRVRTFTLTNGDAPAVTIAAVEGDDVFVVSSTTCGPQLAGGGATCQVVVSFDPSIGEGDYAGVLTVRGPAFTLTTALSATVQSDESCLALTKKDVPTKEDLLPCP